MVPAARAETRESPQRSLPQAVVETNSAADPIAELQKRMDAPPMALGGDKSRTLMQQIAELKLKRQNKQFAHAESETGFALTGAHAKVECASCHTKAFEEPIKPSDTPRPCVGCHKKDDVHRGRRQNCASCHTTKNWTEIIRD